MNQITDEEILDNYAWGWELSQANKPFPVWFKSEAEKISCLIGYQAFDLNLVLENNEVIKEVRSKLQ